MYSEAVQKLNSYTVGQPISEETLEDLKYCIKLSVCFMWSGLFTLQQASETTWSSFNLFDQIIWNITYLLRFIMQHYLIILFYCQ